MVVARHSHGQLLIIDRLREMVRLGAGLEPDGRLDKVIAARAIACLERFGQRLRDMHARSVRVVGTNALRQARGKQSFLERAREALGHPIEIISGMEEARLIYSGVAHTMPSEPQRRLVCDIGGGSTELIIGEALTPLHLESTQLGCVSMSRRFFDEGKVSAKRMQRARVAARLELEPVQQGFRRRGWDQAVGSSGTVRAIYEALREIAPQTAAITSDALELLIERLVQAGDARDLGLAAVTSERAPVFAGGVVILMEVFEALGIEAMHKADGAMREGLLHDMVGRYTDEDARERTVRAMQARYHVDVPQAERVEHIALAMLEQVAALWQLDEPLAELALQWAARLHEIGLDVSHTRHHQHGAYLLENGDMPGFPREEQRLLAQLVGCHRRRLSLQRLEELLPPWDRRALGLIVLLRLAVLLCRGRSEVPAPALELTARARSLDVKFPRHWLQEHPLTFADLAQEIEHLRDAGFRLRVYGN